MVALRSSAFLQPETHTWIPGPQLPETKKMIEVLSLLEELDDAVDALGPACAADSEMDALRRDLVAELGRKGLDAVLGEQITCTEQDDRIG